MFIEVSNYFGCLADKTAQSADWDRRASDSIRQLIQKFGRVDGADEARRFAEHAYIIMDALANARSVGRSSAGNG